MFVSVSDGIRRLAIVVPVLIVVGIFLWMVNAYVPMANSIKDILNIVVVIGTCIFVLQAVGLWRAIMRIWDGLTRRILPPQARP